MIFLVTVIVVQLAAIAWSAANDGAGLALPLSQCALALLGLALPDQRRGMIDVVLRYWIAALAYLVLVGSALYAAGAFSFAALSDERAPRAELLRLIGFGVSTLTIAGAASAAGRRTVQSALLLMAAAIGALALAAYLRGATKLGAAGEATAVFMLLAMLAAFAVIDALAVRQVSQPGAAQATRAERLFLPIIALVSAILGLALFGWGPSAPVIGVSLAMLGASLLARERRRGAGQLLLGLLTAAPLAAGIAYWSLTGRAMLLGPAVSVTVAFCAALLAWIAFLVRLATSQDRSRRPSRGLGLALAAGAVFLFAGPGASAPSVLAIQALVLGLAAAHADALVRFSSTQRSLSPT